MRVTRSVRLAPAAACALALLLVACSGDDGDDQVAAASPTAGTAVPTAGPTASGGTTAAPTTGSSAAATGSPSGVGVRTLPAVRVGRTAAFDGTVVVRVTTVTRTTVQANGPGEIAGDGVAVRLAVRNSSARPFDLAGLAVTATYGKGRGQPAIPSSSQSSDLLAGSLAPGRAATGTYIFLVPRAQARSVKVEVSSDASADVLTFRR